MDGVQSASWGLSTLVHLVLVCAALIGGVGTPADGSAASAGAAASATEEASAGLPESSAFVLVPEQVAVAEIPLLEPTELPPLPAIDPSNPLGDLLLERQPAEAIATAPAQGLESSVGPLIEARPVAEADDKDLTERYREFAAQISNRLMYRYHSQWRSSFRGSLRGDEVLMRLHIRNSSVMRAELLPGESSGDPAFDAILLEHLNRPAREGRPFNALAVPDRLLTTPIRFR
jgi:hypothetical protein